MNLNLTMSISNRMVLVMAALVAQALCGAETKPLSSSALRGRGIPQFRKQVLTDQYYCDGITSEDIDRDGKVDIIAGPFWYEGPGFTNKHEIYPAKVFP